MEQVSISKLKDQLSAYLKRVQEGHTLVVTDRNKPVALLTAITARGSRHDQLASLEARGLVSRPAGKPVDLHALLHRRPKITGAGVLEALLAEREEGP